MKRYNPKDIEPRWQQNWIESKIYEASSDQTKPKRYIAEYFPYPSGAAMHVGHVRNYTIGDVMSRHARMQGYNVLHPMGWDAFGLPAENYALKTGISPQQAITENTGKFKQQLTAMGFSYDWSREFSSSDPDYYRWTQWFFLLLYKRGLAYNKEALQWWCPNDQTVLANEQVENGRCWRCGHEVEKKALKQWFFKITDYADRLEADLTDLDWSESIKSMQRNWIGRSTGAEVHFDIVGFSEDITVFTTRADTLSGATFLVLAPEHPLLRTIVPGSHRQQVENYQQKVRDKSDIERQETNRDKTGVFTGAYAINPINGQQLPIWTADYVLMGYGTGAIMAVPAHDDRDMAFAKAFNLPVIFVVEPTFGKAQGNDIQSEKIYAVLRNPRDQTAVVLNWGPRQKNYGGNMLIGGTVEAEEEHRAAAEREIYEETGYKNVVFVKEAEFKGHGYFYSNVKEINVHASGKGMLFDLVDDERDAGNLDDGEKEKFSVVWQPLDKIAALLDDGVHEAMFRYLALGESYHGDGVLINSGVYDGLTTTEARQRIITDLAVEQKGAQKVNYRMRDWLISRQRYWGAPIPMIHCPKDGIVPVPEDQLPVILPELKDFKPSGDGRSPLANVPEFLNTTCPTCGGPAERETDTMDGFACSSWYLMRFTDPHNNEQPFDADKVTFWMPVDDYIGGAEHAVMHLLYARMWTKVMQDAGLISFGEPFKALRNHGMILAPDGQKMSKSKGNTIQPDELIDQGYGADSIRIMELFLGPWNQMANWSVEGMGGSYRFLQRIWNLVQEHLDSRDDSLAIVSQDLPRAVHRTIKKVSDDLSDMGFNTAIASMMELTNELYKLKNEVPIGAPVWYENLSLVVQLLAPFAPHIAEEMWHQLGYEASVHISEWPTYNEQYLREDTVTIVVQVNGKLRAQLKLSKDLDQAGVEAAARADANVQKYFDGTTIVKVIYIPSKLLNFVIR